MCTTPFLAHKNLWKLKFHIQKNGMINHAWLKFLQFNRVFRVTPILFPSVTLPAYSVFSPQSLIIITPSYLNFLNLKRSPALTDALSIICLHRSLPKKKKNTALLSIPSSITIGTWPTTCWICVNSDPRQKKLIKEEQLSYVSADEENDEQQHKKCKEISEWF